MKKIVLAICCLFLAATASTPQESPDFSGNFALKSMKGDRVAKTLPKSLLKVVQNGTLLEIVETFDSGKTMTSRYALDGNESKNTTEGGVPTVDKAEVKGKTLVIRSSYRLTNGVPVHETQKWELSADARTLKIRRQTQFEGMSMLDETTNETYQRR